MSELVLDVPIANRRLVVGHGADSGGECESIDHVDLIHRCQTDDHLFCLDHVHARLRPRTHSQHRCVTQPENRRHRREIPRALAVYGTEKSDRRAEVQDGGVDQDGRGRHVYHLVGEWGWDAARSWAEKWTDTVRDRSLGVVSTLRRRSAQRQCEAAAKVLCRTRWARSPQWTGHTLYAA
ncbi:protein of unknown function [Agreia sp. COWG]|nr:protein of unknown function [Agreia sp. COWG]